MPFEKIVPPDKFYFCFWEWIETDCDSCRETRFRYSDDKNLLQKQIIGADIKVTFGRIANSATEGVQFIEDFRFLLSNFGLGDTFDYTWRFYDIEQFLTFFDDFILPLMLTLLAVLIIILVITADPIATVLVGFCILVTDLFLSGLIFYWGLTINPMIFLQIILGIGTSVDFSAHIAYEYLIQ